MKTRFIEKLISHLDHLDSDSVQTQFMRLAREKGLLETIFNAIQDGILVLDSKGAIQYANAATERLLGIDTEHSLGENVRKYVKDIDWDLISSLDPTEWDRLIRREIEITYPDHRFIELYVSPLATAEDDEEHGVLIMLRDVTKERAHVADTLESEKLNAIMLLAAGVAHEIGNPLNSLNIHLQLMEREVSELKNEEDQENLGELVDIAKKEIIRLDQILNEFLGALRPSQPNFASGDLAEVLKETHELIKQEAENREVWIELDIPEKLPPLQFDKNQIKQVCFNLLKNATEAMPDGGLIKVDVSSNDRFVEIRFSDNGPGIPADVLQNIFEPYQSTKEEGSGLGLMIVQRIIRDHGGLIEIESKPEKGTSFTLFLPREDQRIRLLEPPKKDKQHE